MKNKTLTAILFLTLFSISSCQKEDENRSSSESQLTIANLNGIWYMDMAATNPDLFICEGDGSLQLIRSVDDCDWVTIEFDQDKAYFDIQLKSTDTKPGPYYFSRPYSLPDQNHITMTNPYYIDTWECAITDNGNTLTIGTQNKYVYKRTLPPIILIKNIDRVPIIHSSGNPFEIKTKITVGPSLAQGQSITLELSNIQGTGDAVFDNGSNTMTIQGTETVGIRGKVNSDTKDNIKLTASYNGNVMATELFTVRTYISEFNVVVTLDYPLIGELTENFNWESESGNKVDLIGLKIGEKVVYPNSSSPVTWPSPPYSHTNGNPYQWSNPSVLFFVIDQTNYNLGAKDFHFIPASPLTETLNQNFNAQNAFTTGNYVYNQISANQTYWFSDPLLSVVEATLKGPYTITRTVAFSNNQWKYKIEKIGDGSTYMAELILQ